MNQASSLDRARAAKAHAYAVFSQLADVVGIGVTTIDAGYGLKINLSSPPSESVELPREVDGVPVRNEVVGRIRKRLPR